MACGKNGNREGATITLFPYFMKKSVATALMSRLSFRSISSQFSVRKGVLTIYCHVVDHLLETYAKDDFIAEIDRGIALYIKFSTI